MQAPKSHLVAQQLDGRDWSWPDVTATSATQAPTEYMMAARLYVHLAGSRPRIVHILLSVVPPLLLFRAQQPQPAQFLKPAIPMTTSAEPSPGPFAQLCLRCRGLELLGTKYFRNFDFEDEWPALNGLEQSAAAGCHFCGMLREEMIAAPNVLDDSWLGPERPEPGRIKLFFRLICPDECLKPYCLRVYCADIASCRIHPRLGSKEEVCLDDYMSASFLLHMGNKVGWRLHLILDT